MDNVVDGTFTATEPITDRLTVPVYDGFGRVTTSIQNYDPTTVATDLNQTSTTRYDGISGRVIASQDMLGRWSVPIYDTAGRTVQTILNCRDAQGNPTWSNCVNPQNRSDRSIPSSRTGFDALGRISTSTDILNTVTKTEYDALGRTKKTIQKYVAGQPSTATQNVTTETIYADVLGTQVTTLDPTGAQSVVVKDALLRTVRTVDADGIVTLTGYDGTGQQRWQKLPNDTYTVTLIDGVGRAIKTVQNYQDGTHTPTEAVDRDLITQVEYDALGQRITAITPDGRITHYRYDGVGQLVQVQENVLSASLCAQSTRNDCNLITTYHYDRAGNRAAVIDAKNQIRRFVFDSAGRMKVSRDALNIATTWDYDTLGRPTHKYDPRGAAFDILYRYDELDRITETLALDSTKLAPIAISYDQAGRRTSMTDGVGTTTYGYDGLSQVNQVATTGIGTVDYTYTARGERDTLTINGVTTNYDYTLGGRLDRVIHGTTTVADYQYHPTTGQLTDLIRPDSDKTQYTYDSVGRVAGIAHMNNGRSLQNLQYEFNIAGQISTITETVGLTQTISPVVPFTTTAQLRSLGTGSTVTPNDIAVGDLNKDGKLDAVTVGRESGKLRVTFGNGNGTFQTPVEYPADYGVFRVVLADLDSDGNLDAVVANRLSNTLGIFYGTGTGTLAAQVTLATGSSTTPVNVAVGDLNRDGRLDLVSASSGTNTISVLLATGTRTFAAAQAVTIGDTNARAGGVALADVNRDGKLDAVVTNNPQSQLVTLLGTGTGAFGSPTSVATQAGPNTPVVAEMTGDQSLDVVVPNGSANTVQVFKGTGTGSFTAFSSVGVAWNPVTVSTGDVDRNGTTDVVATTWYGGQMQLMLNDGTGALTLQAQGYVIGGQASAGILADTNRDGRLDLLGVSWYSNAINTFLNSTGTQRVTAYTYDGVGRLTHSTEPGKTTDIGYDVVGNRTSYTENGTVRQALQYNANNQVSNAGYSYDAAGNLTADGRQTYTWDALGRLVQTTPQGQPETTALYNGDGILMKETRNSVTTTYLQDTQARLSQILRSTTGSATIDYVYGLERLASVQTGVYTWEYHDALGSVRMQRTQGSNVIQALRYDAWGQPQAGTPNPFGFTGEYQNTTTGLTYLRARWYNPTTGTLLGRDPFAGYAESPYSLHSYQYGYSNPVSNTDPSGASIEGIASSSTCIIGYALPKKHHGSFNPRDLTCWLYQEMMSNLDDPELGRIRGANIAGLLFLYGYLKDCEKNGIENASVTTAGLALYYFAEAGLSFRELVKDHAVWDFKHTIKEFMGEGITLCTNSGCTNTINYSVPGNIHYGFVARAGGFANILVQAGAGYAEIADPAHVVDPSQRPSDVSYVEYDGTFGVIQTPDGPSIILGDNEQDAASIVLGMELYDRYNKGRSLTFTDFQREISRYLPQMQMGPLSPVSVEERIANDWPYWIGYFNPTPFGRIGNLPYHIK